MPGGIQAKSDTIVDFQKTGGLRFITVPIHCVPLDHRVRFPAAILVVTGFGESQKSVEQVSILSVFRPKPISAVSEIWRVSFGKAHATPAPSG
jgi:hypothetical protein